MTSYSELKEYCISKDYMAGEKNWIALNMVKGVGTAALKEIHGALAAVGVSIDDIMDLSCSELKNEFSFSDKICAAFTQAQPFIEECDTVCQKMLEAGIEIIPFFSEKYPVLLHKRLGNTAPALLYVHGDISMAEQPCVALLGDRNISPRGEMIAWKASQELSRHSVTLVSGMAAGAGIITHRAALESRGKTIAVIPSGMLTFSLPREIEEVYLPDNMTIISPFYPETAADVYHAFTRNRIICALSLAVYIIEAPADGGIFEAAKSARDLDVPLYTTEYAKYPDNAAGNERIIKEMNGTGIRGRIVNDTLTPNIDAVIAHTKFL